MSRIAIQDARAVSEKRWPWFEPAAFPLILTFSLGEKEQMPAVPLKFRAPLSSIPLSRGECFSLSLRERAGVRGKDALFQTSPANKPNHSGALALLLLFIPIFLLTGCATTELAPPVNLPRSEAWFPADALVSQRAVLTVRGRQFSLNGYVIKSAAHGLRLVVTENFGGVLADVIVKPDGNVLVLKARPPFRLAWVENHIAADLKCIFSDATAADCPIQRLSPTHFVIARQAYQLDLRITEVKPGMQSAASFEAAPGGKP